MPSPHTHGPPAFAAPLAVPPQDDILNNSSDYLNAMLFLAYLFVAIFIMLSMFLAILGEAQGQVRENMRVLALHHPFLHP